MHIGIDASNLRLGGGITHLVELLGAADPVRDGFNRVTVWGSERLLARLPQRQWITQVHVRALDGGLFRRALWQTVELGRRASDAGVDLLFAPGGSYTSRFEPAVTMSRNLLPFDPSASRRYGVSLQRLKLAALTRVQSASFRRAAGLIFLTNTARSIVEGRIGSVRAKVAVIPHGITRRMFRDPARQRAIDSYTTEEPFRVLYVSIIDVYKHQTEVSAAVVQLRSEGYPVVLDLVGSAPSPAGEQLEAYLDQVDPSRNIVRFLGEIPYADLPDHYHRADLFVFASSCENLPNILLEAMAAGLPIACSNRSVMPEVLGPQGVYFDPVDPDAIATAIRDLLDSPVARAASASSARARAGELSWDRCARETFAFLGSVLRGHEGMTEVGPGPGPPSP